MKNFLIPLFLLGLLLISPCDGIQANEIPVLHARVTDMTGTLSSSERQSLEDMLAAHEDSTTTQIAVLLIKTLNGEDLFEYTHAVAEKNHIGTEGRNNGILLLVVMDDHKVRIHVGYGLEGALPDATTKLIIEDEIIPRFREQEYYNGILAGTQAIEEAVKGEYKAENRTDRDGRSRSLRGFGWPIFIGIILLFIFISRMARAAGAVVNGRGYKRYSSGLGGFWWGGGSGGGSGFGGGGFGGGGGWSGGGGSFGGGGASGSW